MKRSKRIYALLGVLCVVCIATFCVMRFEEQKEQIKNSDEIILALSVDSVQSLSWDYNSEVLGFHKVDKWLYDGDEAFPVDEEKINNLLAQFEQFGAAFIIEKVENYGQYGLNDPICTINITTTEQDYEILLGNYSNMDSQRYVSIGDENVYLVKHDPLDYFDVVLSDMIDHDEPPLFNEVTDIRFEGKESCNIVYAKDSADAYYPDDIYFARQGGRNLPLDTSNVNSYLNSISNLNLTDYVTYHATAEELQDYSLDVPELTITVNHTFEDADGNEIPGTFILHVSRDPKQVKAAEDDSGEEEIIAYARVGESQIIYTISSDSYKKLAAASYDSLRHHEVLTADFADIYRIDVSLENVDYTITSKNSKNGERTYYYLDDELEIAELQAALNALNADRFTDEKPMQKEEIRLKVYLDSENHPEIQIELYRYDKTHCLAIVDGEPISFVARSYVVDLIEAVYAIVLN